MGEDKKNALEKIIDLSALGIIAALGKGFVKYISEKDRPQTVDHKLIYDLGMATSSYVKDRFSNSTSYLKYAKNLLIA